MADLGGRPRRLGVGVVVGVEAGAATAVAFLGGRPRGRPVEVGFEAGLLEDLGVATGGEAAAAALGVATEARLVL